MKRKVIKQRDSYTVTLPIKWVKEHGINESLEIDVQEEKEGIIIQSEGITKKKETELKINSDSEPFIRINLNDLYRLGYDKIKVIFQTGKQKNLIIDAAENFLLGFEAVEEGKDYVILENVAEPSAEKQDVLLRRMFLLIKESMEQVGKDFADGKFKSLDRIKQISQKVSQYDNFCRRNVSKKRFTEERANFYWGLYVYLLLIQHNIKHMYDEISKMKSLKMGTRIKLFNRIVNEFDNIYNGFYKKDLEMLNKSQRELKKLDREIKNEISKSKGNENVVLYYYADLGRLAYLSSSPMLGVLL